MRRAAAFRRGPGQVGLPPKLTVVVELALRAGEDRLKTALENHVLHDVSHLEMILNMQYTSKYNTFNINCIRSHKKHIQIQAPPAFATICETPKQRSRGSRRHLVLLVPSLSRLEPPEWPRKSPPRGYSLGETQEKSSLELTRRSRTMHGRPLATVDLCTAIILHGPSLFCVLHRQVGPICGKTGVRRRPCLLQHGRQHCL